MLDNIKLKKVDFATTVVTNVGALVLAQNLRRCYALITNVSNVDIWLYFGSQGIVGQGIFLPGNGFSYEIDRMNLWQGAIYAIHSSGGSKNVVTHEGY